MDKGGQCALVHAALRGHSEVIECLLELSWSTEGQQDLSLKNKALQQGLIAACSMGHIHVSTHTLFLLWCNIYRGIFNFYERNLFF